MNSELEVYKTKTFDDIKHIDELGNFKKVIDKAKISCRVSGNNISDCFADIGKSIISGKGRTK